MNNPLKNLGKKLIVAAAAAALLCMFGCSSEPDPLVGKWQGTGYMGINLFSSQEYDESIAEVSEDGTIVMTFAGNSHTDEELKATFEGTWKRSDNPSKSEEDSEESKSIKYEALMGETTYTIYYTPGDAEDGSESAIVLAVVDEEGDMDITKPSFFGHPYKEEVPLTKDEVDAKIAEQPVKVTSTEYLVQDEEYKNLYPDFLMATVKNNSKTDIKSLTLGYVAWDENGLPVMIHPDGSDPYYYIECDMDNANIAAGESWNEAGVALSGLEPSNIATFKVIVASYTDSNGETWTNPVLKDWQKVYENQPLKK